MNKWVIMNLTNSEEEKSTAKPPFHYGSKVHQNDALGEEIAHLPACSAGLPSTANRSAPLHSSPLHSAPLHAATLAGSFASEKVAMD